MQGLLIDAAKWALSTGKKSLDEKNEYHQYALDYLERRNDGSRTRDYDEKGKGEFVKGMYMALKKAKDEKTKVQRLLYKNKKVSGKLRRTPPPCSRAKVCQ